MSSPEQDFTAFYDATWARAVACGYAILGEIDAAEEAAQNAYSRAWAHWSSVETYCEPTAWVCQDLARHTHGRWAAGRAGHLAEPTARGPDEASLALVAALSSLPPAARRALVLHHLAGLTTVEIAEQERCPLGTVEARLASGDAACAGFPIVGPGGTSRDG